MINPSSFIDSGQEDEFIDMSGSFSCDDCQTITNSARWNMTQNIIYWKCSKCGKEGNASL